MCHNSAHFLSLILIHVTNQPDNVINSICIWCKLLDLKKNTHSAVFFPCTSFQNRNPFPLNYSQTRFTVSVAVKLRSSERRVKSRGKRRKVISKARKTKKAKYVRGGGGPWNGKEGGTQGDGGNGSQVFAESAGAGAINLAGISELMNVIKIQPPAS